MDTFNISPESFNPDIIDFDRPAPEETTVYTEEPPAREPETRTTAPRRETSARPASRQPAQSGPKPSAKASRRTSPAAQTVTANRRQGRSLWQILTDSRTRIFMGIVLGIATVYLLMVTISYFSTVVHDQSTVINNTLGDMAARPQAVKNAGGPLGAWVSDLLITRWMGLGVFIMLFYLGGVTLMLLNVSKLRFWPFTFRCLLSTVALSVIIGLLTWQLESVILWGGAHGHYFNAGIISLAGLPGAICVSAVMAGLLVVLFLNDLRKLFRKGAEAIARRRELMAERRAERERERERLEAEARENELRKAQTVQTGQTSQTSQTGPTTETAETAETTESARPAQPAPPSPADAPLEALSIPTLGDMEIHNAPIEQVKEGESVSPELVIEGRYDPRADLSHFAFPTLELLHERPQRDNNVDNIEQEENKNRIIETLQNYGISISKIKATVGPTVTLYEIIPAEGVRIARIKQLEDDIALSLAALGIRIIAPIPGKGTIGIEVPNKEPQTVSIRSIIGSKAFQDCRMELPMAMGSTISNEVFIADLTKMPHLLVAGATGMGKSVGLNTIIASLLYKKHPAELKFVLIDPKMVEFSLYARLERHYLAKLPGDDDAIITDPSKVVATLNSLCLEMDNRYNLLKDAGCRNIKEYNEKFITRHLNPEKGHRYLPYVVVIVDEFADLIMTAGKEVETPIARIAQKARAVGMHMILATQRPSTNVITGIIKANFPGRIAFRVFQMVDSRTILDCPGANQLIGRGDMLFSNNGKMDRVQCAFIDTDEVEAICEAINSQQGYVGAYELPEFVPDDIDSAAMNNLNDRDPLFAEAARFAVTSDTASTSSLQRRYSIGYNRAGKIMDQMEAAGIVGPSMGGKPRQVMIDSLQLERLLEQAD